MDAVAVKCNIPFLYEKTMFFFFLHIPFSLFYLTVNMSTFL